MKDQSKVMLKQMFGAGKPRTDIPFSYSHWA